MEKIVITVGKDFVDNYRKYKIDLINGGEVDIDYEIFSRTVEDSPASMREILSAAVEDDTVSMTISTESGLEVEVSGSQVSADAFDSIFSFENGLLDL